MPVASLAIDVDAKDSHTRARVASAALTRVIVRRLDGSWKTFPWKSAR